jgi:hypothetical protein
MTPPKNEGQVLQSNISRVGTASDRRVPLWAGQSLSSAEGEDKVPGTIVHNARACD